MNLVVRLRTFGVDVSFSERTVCCARQSLQPYEANDRSDVGSILGPLPR